MLFVSNWARRGSETRRRRRRDGVVRDEARTALEQMESPDVLDRLQTLMDEGLFS